MASKAWQWLSDWDHHLSWYASVHVQELQDVIISCNDAESHVALDKNCIHHCQLKWQALRMRPNCIISFQLLLYYSAVEVHGWQLWRLILYAFSGGISRNRLWKQNSQSEHTTELVGWAEKACCTQSPKKLLQVHKSCRKPEILSRSRIRKVYVNF